MGEPIKREYGGALVVWPGMPFPNLDGTIPGFIKRDTGYFGPHRSRKVVIDFKNI